MSHNRLLLWIVSCLAFAPFPAVPATSADQDFATDARVTLDAYQATVEARLAGVLAATRTQRAAEPVMHPGRVDVIGGGALVLDRILTLGGFDEVIVSEHDILDGIALSLTEGAQ